MLKVLKTAFKDLFTTLHKVFLEITGFLFLAIGGLILLSGYKLLRSLSEFEDASWFKIGSTLVFGLIMVGYGIHSFYRVRTMK